MKLLNQTVGSTYGQRVNIDDHEVKGHGEGHGRKQPEVAPWGHANQRLVLRQALNNKNKRNYESNSSFTWCWNNLKHSKLYNAIYFLSVWNFVLDSNVVHILYSRFHSKSPHFDFKGS